MTLVDDQMAIICDNVVDLASPDETLYERDIDDVGRPPLAAADRSDSRPGAIKKSRKPLNPLVHKLTPVNQHESIDPSLRDQLGRGHRLAKCGGRCEYSKVVCTYCIERLDLIRSQCPNEIGLNWLSLDASVVDRDGDAQ